MVDRLLNDLDRLPGFRETVMPERSKAAIPSRLILATHRYVFASPDLSGRGNLTELVCTSKILVP